MLVELVHHVHPIHRGVRIVEIYEVYITGPDLAVEELTFGASDEDVPLYTLKIGRVVSDPYSRINNWDPTKL